MFVLNNQKEKIGIVNTRGHHVPVAMRAVNDLVTTYSQQLLVPVVGEGPAPVGERTAARPERDLQPQDLAVQREAPTLAAMTNVV